MVTDSPAASVARIDGDRLLARLAELATIGADPTGGITRLAYSRADVAARDLVSAWCAQAGLTPHVDAATNLLATRDGLRPGLGHLAIGSHLDTVVNAGHLDGAYGVVAAVEIAMSLHEAGLTLRHPLAVVGFSNEEGARGTPGMVGSSTVAGVPPPMEFLDDEGVPLGERLRQAGGDPSPDAIEAAVWPPGWLAGWLEVHIEQGPVLEAEGLQIGVVQAITGRVNVEIEVTGQPQHAGTTPMPLRRDAMVAAARVVLAVEALATDGVVRVATVGRLDVTPGVRNTVPGAAKLSLEARDVDAGRLAAGIGELRARLATIADATGCTATLTVGPAVTAVPADPVLMGCVSEAADALSLTKLMMPSGAGHDAQVVAAAGPFAMCFVPSRGGVSHAPQEASDDGDLVNGARVLLAALLLADVRLDA